MISIFKKPLLALLFFGLTAGIVITSCKKNNDASTSKVELLSFGPSGAKVGDTIRFIGNNLNQVTEIDFTGKAAVLKQSAFIQQTSSQILVKVPQQAERGFLTLKTSQGDIVTKTMLDLDVVTIITSITK